MLAEKGFLHVVSDPTSCPIYHVDTIPSLIKSKFSLEMAPLEVYDLLTVREFMFSKVMDDLEV